MNPGQQERLIADVAEIKDFLLGNAYNNKKGLNATIDDHESRLITLEDHKSVVQVYTDIIKWLLRILGAGAIGILIYWIQLSFKK